MAQRRRASITHELTEITTAAAVAFAKHDIDHSGRIDAAELRNALQDTGLDISAEQCEYVIRRYISNEEEDTEVFGEKTLGMDDFIKVVEDARAGTVVKMNEQRLGLRTEQHVQQALDAWWVAAVLAPSGETGSSSSARPGMVQRNQYVAILVRIFKAMMADYDEGVAIKTAEEEAKTDCRGRSHLEKDALKDGMCVPLLSQKPHHGPPFERPPCM